MSIIQELIAASLITEEQVEIANSIVRISDLLNKYHENGMSTNIVRYDEILLSAYGGELDALFYNDHPVIDFKVAWGHEAFEFNYVSVKSIHKEDYKNVIIFDPNYTVFYSDIEGRINSDMEYNLDFNSPESFLFQMQLMLEKEYDLFCIMYILHLLKYKYRAYLHIFSLNVYNKIEEKIEGVLLRREEVYKQFLHL